MASSERNLNGGSSFFRNPSSTLITGIRSGEPLPDLERGISEGKGGTSAGGMARSDSEGRGARFDFERGRMGIRDAGVELGLGGVMPGDRSTALCGSFEEPGGMDDLVRVRGTRSSNCAAGWTRAVGISEKLAPDIRLDR